MKRNYFMQTQRMGFSLWTEEDLPLARLLWGDPKVTRYICASGVFTEPDIWNRLQTELTNGHKYRVQYWPVFSLETGELVGCCGLRPWQGNGYEIGFHLRPQFWGQGYAAEAAQRVIDYAFHGLMAEKLFAGHNPNNTASRRVLSKLGFIYIGDEYYQPTGLYHPSYELLKR